MLSDAVALLGHAQLLLGIFRCRGAKEVVYTLT